MTKKSGYLPRLADIQLKKYLETFGAVCIEGPKWCGKTRTAEEISRSRIYLGDPAGGFQNRSLAEMAPAAVLKGETPRLIDEWQEVPPLWDAVRFQVDHADAPGQFLLTGSATPNHKGILHSGAGRIARLRMRPMSLWESGDSDGKVSLLRLLHGELEPEITGEVALERLVQLIVRGGWPASLSVAPENQSLLPQQYLKAVLDDDATRIDGIQRNRKKLELVLRSLARNEATTAGVQTICRDIADCDGETVERVTVYAYLDVFSRLFLIDNQRPFAPSVRSSVRIKQAEKRHLCDPSLAAALLGMKAEALTADLPTMGFLFEALCERDLRIYAEALGAELFHYQDYKNREIDAVIALPTGEWTAIEIKLGANQIDAAAEGLLKLQKALAKEDPANAPSVLCVLCGMTNAAYRRPDGVFVVPLLSLKP